VAQAVEARGETFFFYPGERRIHLRRCSTKEVGRMGRGSSETPTAASATKCLVPNDLRQRESAVRSAGPTSTANGLEVRKSRAGNPEPPARAPQTAPRAQRRHRYRPRPHTRAAKARRRRGRAGGRGVVGTRRLDGHRGADIPAARSPSAAAMGHVPRRAAGRGRLHERVASGSRGASTPQTATPKSARRAAASGYPLLDGVRTGPSPDTPAPTLIVLVSAHSSQATTSTRSQRIVEARKRARS